MKGISGKIMLFYPVLILLILYLVFFIQCLFFSGSFEATVRTDPKDTALSGIFTLLLYCLLILTPLALLYTVYLVATKKRKALPSIIIWLTGLGLYLADPLGIISWLFD